MICILYVTLKGRLLLYQQPAA